MNDSEYTIAMMQELNSLKWTLRHVYDRIVSLNKIYPDSIETHAVHVEFAMLLAEAKVRNLLPNHWSESEKTT
jgi:hypothetical protein